ncbi:hypothetical protein CFC21_092247 [Triticum aestivum]|uniref:Uncharacterized protein n=2 Tax=Triticum aestivum TaxID=4565 RepID=A0A3B6QCX2_WHEAT|nr:hypothetical protein CFC21_092247 [Triticum aestivum]
MGGDIAVWSARQTNASYDERDQISIFTALIHLNIHEGKNSSFVVYKTLQPAGISWFYHSFISLCGTMHTSISVNIHNKLFVLYNIYQIKTKILQKPPKNMIKYRKSTWLRHPRKELAALALKPGRAKALRHQLRMF